MTAQTARDNKATPVQTQDEDGAQPGHETAPPVQRPDQLKAASGLYPAHPGLSAITGKSTDAPPPRSVDEASEPYPPISDQALNGPGPPAAGKRRINPRSPRAALEPEHVPVPTRRSRHSRHPLVKLGNAVLTLLVLLVIAGGVLLFIGREQFKQPGPLPQDHVVVIPRGYGVRNIADLLNRQGVIDKPWLFVAGVFVLRAHEELKSGEYKFEKHASLEDVLDTIIEGKVVQHLFTVPEGYTSEQVVASLMQNPALSGNISEIPPEGTLLPESYKFTRGASRERILRRMHRAQQRLVKEIWAHRMPDLPLKNPQQLIILASIIEKETGRADERTRVAAVFVNRLRHHMRLQSDPTIIYGLVGGKGSLGHPITEAEKQQPTPYNTYLIDGLPPGPIDNPGRASLEAAANPARTRELYFVADGKGGHVFSDTYAQHEKAVARLRALEREQKANASAPALRNNEASDPADSAPKAGAGPHTVPEPPPRPHSR